MSLSLPLSQPLSLGTTALLVGSQYGASNLLAGLPLNVDATVGWNGINGSVLSGSASLITSRSNDTQKANARHQLPAIPGQSYRFEVRLESATDGRGSVHLGRGGSNKILDGPNFLVGETFIYEFEIPSESDNVAITLIGESNVSGNTAVWANPRLTFLG